MSGIFSLDPNHGQYSYAVEHPYDGTSRSDRPEAFDHPHCDGHGSGRSNFHEGCERGMPGGPER
jgi:hypothetical protein